MKMIGFDEYKAQRMCKNLLKINEDTKTVTISLDVERSGLELDYQNICYIMKRFFDKMMFFYDVLDERRWKSVELKDSVIVLTKW